MMPGIEEVAARVRGKPLHDPAWLVFADWLLTRGDVRGKLIALERELHFGGLPLPERRALGESMGALRAPNEARWRAGLRLGKRTSASWQAGFLMKLGLKLGPHTVPLLAHLQQKTSAVVLAELDLRRSRVGVGQLRELAEAPPLTRIPGLNLSQCKLNDAGARILAEGPASRLLQTLRLSHNGVGDEGVAAVAASLTELHTLDLSGTAVGHEGVAALSQLPHLRHLDLGLTQGTEAVAQALVRHPGPLASLGMRFARREEAALMPLVTHPGLSSLTKLDVSGNRVGDGFVEALAEGVTLPALTTLDLTSTRVTDAGVAAFCRGGPRSLTELTVRSDHLGDGGAAALAASTAFPELRILRLGSCAAPPSGRLNRMERFSMDSPLMGRETFNHVRSGKRPTLGALPWQKNCGKPAQAPRNRFGLHVVCRGQRTNVDILGIAVERAVNRACFNKDICDALHEVLSRAAQPFGRELLFDGWEDEGRDGFHRRVFIHACIFGDDGQHGGMVGFVGPHGVGIRCHLEEFRHGVRVFRNPAAGPDVTSNTKMPSSVFSAPVRSVLPCSFIRRREPPQPQAISTEP